MSDEYFDTERLRVHQFRFCPKPESGERLFFVAFSLDVNAWEKPIVSVVVRQHPTFAEGRAYVDWVETADDSRREGYATEVLRAIEKRLGHLLMDAGTSAGKGFIEQYREPEAAMPRWLAESAL